MDDNYYLQLSDSLKFDPVSQSTNVFFDDTNRQIFIVKSCTLSVKSISNQDFEISFPFSTESSPLIAIKFNSDNSILAILRSQDSLQLKSLFNNQLLPAAAYEQKKLNIYGFVWSQIDELVVITNDYVELFNINSSKKTMKLIKSLPSSSNWYAGTSKFLLLSSNNGLVLTPILLTKPKTLTKLACILLGDEPCQSRDVNIGILYNKPAILLLRTKRNRNLEIWVYLLDGPVFQKRHIIMLGFSGRVAVSIIDSIIIVHHQTLKVSLIFDIAMKGEVDPTDKTVTIQLPLVPGRSIRPFSIKVPSVSLKESLMNVELYSANWVIFQPAIIIDVKLGYLFVLKLVISKISICDKMKLIDFLMHRRRSEKPHLLSVLSQITSPEDRNESVHLPILKAIFDQLNKAYKLKLENDLLKMQALPSPSTFKSFSTPVAPQDLLPNEIVIEQNEVLEIINAITDNNISEKVLMAYVFSIVKHSISCEYDLSKVLVTTLVASQKVIPYSLIYEFKINPNVKSSQVQDLQQILSFNVLNESKPLACFLLSLTSYDPVISQIALDLLMRLNANEIIVEILLEQGKVIDALRFAHLYTNTDFISARKFLEAALKSGDKMIYYSVYNYVRRRYDFEKGKVSACLQCAKVKDQST